MKLTIIASAVLALGASSAASAQTVQAAGKVLIVAGSASVERAGKQLPLLAGSAVESGDTLSVDDKSTLQIRFTDESVVALRANSQFKIENYKFDKNADTDRSLMGLVKGGMRTITGLIGKANNKNYSVQTATATIGIRGTHFSVVSCNNDCTRPDGAPEANGTYGSVTDGRISVSNTAGMTEFGQQDSFYVSTPNTPPVRLLVPPAILADRGAANRGRVTAAARSTGDSGNSGSSRVSGANESTSPQLVVQSSPNIDLNAGLTRSSPFSAPAVVASLSGGQLPSPISGNPSPSPSEKFIATVGLDAAAPPLSTATSSVFANVFSVAQAIAGEPQLAGAVVVDSASAALALGRFNTINSSPAAAAYWYYVPRTVSFDIGRHRAFGDAQVGTAPTSGIAQYNFVGGTTPTDNFGRLGNFVSSNLTMNYGSQTIQTQTPITITFVGGAGTFTPKGTDYSIPSQTFSMGAGFQRITGLTCIGCSTGVAGDINGQFLGANRQGFAAAITVRSVVQTSTGSGQNLGGNVSVYARQ